MKSKVITSIIILIVAVTFFNIGKSSGKTNQYPTYGSSGFPKNCRALIAANIDGYRTKIYSADEALGSIERNCGRFGRIWNEK